MTSPDLDEESPASPSAFPPPPLTRVDVALYILLILFCAVSFQQKDLPDACRYSMAYLAGHVRDFYDFNALQPPGCAYLPSTYILFALWGLPLKLLGLVKDPTADLGLLFIWFKLLTTLFIAGSAYLVSRIGRSLGLSARNAALMAAFWLSSPLMVYAQFMIGQYDVFTTFFMLAGLYFLLEGRMARFSLSFGIAMSFKYLSVFVFLPLLLLKEKRPLRLAVSTVLLLLPASAEILFYLHSPVFRSRILASGITGLFSSSTLDFAYAKLPIFLFAWTLLCAFCYLKETRDEEESRSWLLYLPVLSIGLFFLFIKWHPQWLLMLTPFLAMAAFLSRKAEAHCLIDVALFYFYLAISTQIWALNVDQSLLQYGVWKNLNPALYDPGSAVYIFRFLPPLQMDFKVAGFSALLTALMIDFSPVFRTTPLDAPRPLESYLSSARLRLWGGIALFLLPTAFAFSTCRKDTTPPAQAPNMSAAPDLTLHPGDELVQSFTAGPGSFKKIVLHVTRFSPPAAPGGGIEVSLRPDAGGRALLRFVVPWTQLSANRDLAASHPRGLPIEAGKRYTLLVKVSAASPLELDLARRAPSASGADSLSLNGKVLCGAAAGGKNEPHPPDCPPVIDILPGTP